MITDILAVGSSIASATTYTGTINNYLNYLVMTERGLLNQYGPTLNFIPRKNVSTTTVSGTSLGRTINTTFGSYQIGYESFNRYQNGLQFINTVTVQPTDGTLTAQTSVNSSSVSSYGAASYSVSTVDYSNNQALGNAEWVSNNFADPTSLFFDCTFTDIAQNSTVLASFKLYQIIRNFEYQVPGGSLTNILTVIEGWDISVTPEMATITLNLSPLQYYQFFTLDSTTLGILDTSRLGW
jgi:hypothetical protein